MRLPELRAAVCALHAQLLANRPVARASGSISAYGPYAPGMLVCHSKRVQTCIGLAERFAHA